MPTIYIFWIVTSSSAFLKKYVFYYFFKIFFNLYEVEMRQGDIYKEESDRKGKGRETTANLLYPSWCFPLEDVDQALVPKSFHKLTHVCHHLAPSSSDLEQKFYLCFCCNIFYFLVKILQVYCLHSDNLEQSFQFNTFNSVKNVNVPPVKVIYS